MKKLVSILSFLFLLSIWSCNGQNSTATTEVQNVDVKAFEALIQKGNVQLIDVRTTQEYQEGHIDGASLQNIRNIDFEQNLDKLDKTKPVLVYCKSGGRSARAADMLKEKGFTQIYNLEGGFTAWDAEHKK